MTQGKDNQQQGRAAVMRVVEPWPESVDGAAVAQRVKEMLNRYVVLPVDTDVAITLWVMHAYAFDTFQISPVLAITSPERRCGKTTLVNVLSELVERPVVASNVTTSVLFRLIEMHSPCVFIDEADTFLKRNTELVGVVNSGQNRGAAYVWRGTGDDHEPRKFGTWAPKVIAGIRNLPDTIEDRAIVTRMRRRLREERVERLRLDRTEEFAEVRRRLQRWANDSRDALRDLDPEVPEILNDRAADNWRPLLAIADLIGGSWPDAARHSAITLSSAAEPEESLEFKMLRDVRRIFREKDRRHLGTDELIRSLHLIDSSPWGEWADGKGLMPHVVAKLLRAYGVKSRSVFVDGRSIRGYRLDDFSDAFSRYLPAVSPASEEVREAPEVRESDDIEDSKPEERDAA